MSYNDVGFHEDDRSMDYAVCVVNDMPSDVSMNGVQLAASMLTNCVNGVQEWSPLDSWPFAISYFGATSVYLLISL